MTRTSTAAACRDLAERGRRLVVLFKDAQDRERLLRFVEELEAQAASLDQQASSTQTGQKV
jgi:hypothetical protein